jgi:hypothetical protein
MMPNVIPLSVCESRNRPPDDARDANVSILRHFYFGNVRHVPPEYRLKLRPHDRPWHAMVDPSQFRERRIASV